MLLVRCGLNAYDRAVELVADEVEILLCHVRRPVRSLNRNLTGLSRKSQLSHFTFLNAVEVCLAALGPSKKYHGPGDTGVRCGIAKMVAFIHDTFCF